MSSVDSHSRAEISKLYQQYRRTFESGDAQQVADFYRFPLHYYTDDGGKSVFDRSQFVDLVEKLLSLYRRLGVAQIVGTVKDLVAVNASASLVSLNWILLRTDGDQTSQLYAATSRYLVVDTADGLKIDALFASDETTKLRAVLRQRRQGRE
ncbi:hypothetical protein Maes01_01157 [Microbulbifer aestuariivivens]|uniref:Nuclear transport factor 2 family protein n=1 Tax=Microbulbifer aestuariivivens TaxID=1908308 RepID=A0ABP9WN02_9GAMM